MLGFIFWIGVGRKKNIVVKRYSVHNFETEYLWAHFSFNNFQNKLQTALNFVCSRGSFERFIRWVSLFWLTQSFSSFYFQLCSMWSEIWYRFSNVYLISSDKLTTMWATGSAESTGLSWICPKSTGHKERKIGGRPIFRCLLITCSVVV